MRNATSMGSLASASAELQTARQGCVELGRQAESIAGLVVPLLRQATQELSRLEAQREELRKPGARESQQALLPRLTERIEEQGQHVKRLERVSRGLKELSSAFGGLGEQLHGGLARHEAEQREQEAIVREEKRMWLQELTSLREQVRGQERPTGASGAQQEELQRLRAENEALPKLRAERDRLAHRVAELEKGLGDHEQTLTAKEQTIEDLRRMIVLLTGNATASAPSSPTAPKPMLAPINVLPVATKSPPKPRPPDTMFGSSTMQLAHSMLETLGGNTPVSPPPVAEAPLAPERRVPSMEIMLGPLDELEAPPPSLPPPVPMLPPVPVVPAVAPMTTAMPRASTRSAPPPPMAKTPAPVPTAPPRTPGRPAGTLVVSEDMFNDMLVAENHSLDGSGKK